MDEIIASLKDHGKEKFFASNKAALKVGEEYVK